VAPPFFAAAYFFVGSLILGTGSLGKNLKEVQQFGMVWSLLSAVPLMFMGVLITDPNGTLGQVLTWIPFSAPVTVVLRLALEPDGVPGWQIVGSFAMMVLSTWIALKLGARLFRVGLLLTGTRPKLRVLLRQARLGI
jgi:ABC-2 type transport system permease protein